MSSPAAKRFDPELFGRDMKTLAEIAGAFTDGASREVVLAIKAAYERTMALAQEIEKGTAEAERLLAAGRKDDPKLDAIKTQLQSIVAEVESIEQKTLPTLMRKLQEVAPSEEIKAKLSQMTDTVNRREAGIAVAGEEQPNESGPGGGDLWS